MTIEALTITGGNEHRYLGTAGGLSVKNNSVVTVVGCVIDGNLGSSGGGVSVSHSTLVMTSCTISNNESRINQNIGGSGGGIVSQLSAVTMTDCLVAGNIASARGGGIFHDSSSQATFTRCSFINNSSATGGAVSGLGGDFSFVDCDFTANTASAAGGALGNSAYGIRVPAAAFSGCTISGNEAANGGAIAFQGTAPHVGTATIELNDTQVSGNTASGSGGGIFLVEDLGEVEVTIRNGGAIVDNCPDNCHPADSCPAAPVSCP